jgi:hypothetical protein
MRRVPFFLSIVLASPALAATTVEHVGKWSVVGEADPMTDAKSCTAYYDPGPKHAIQMTKDSFAVSYGGRGGIEGYRIRFDDDPASELSIPNDIERRVGAFLIRSTDQRFSRLMTAKRVRIQGVTLVAGIVNDDVDLSDLPTLMEKLRGPSCN